jgi:glucan phosphoethanolaminetransferase (alkaline phosphatase superfamily)
MMALIRTSFLRDKSALPGLIAALLFLSLPTLMTIFWPRFSEGQAESFWMGMGIILLPCVFSVPIRTTLLLWLPIAALIPATMIYSLFTGSPIREWAFVVLMETDWHELERFWYGAAAAALLGPLAAWLFFRLVSRQVLPGRRLGWVSRVMIVMFALIVPASNWARTGWEFGARLTQRRLSTVFPFGMIVSVWSAWDIRDSLANRSKIARDITVRAPFSSAGREVYVLVIGESARFGSFQINGYGRETTPLLAKTPGLLSFQHVTAPATVTLMSVPLLLTPATAHSLRNAATMPSVVGLFKRAGFHTAWVSTQRKHGMYDTSCSIYSNDADESRFLSGIFAPGPGTYDSAYDGDLLEPARELMARHDSRLLIVLHTMGSHQHYCDRFPPAFNHFPCYPMRFVGNPFTGKFNAEEQRNLTNAYDNSILYTDWVLSQLIDSLKATHAVSALYYVSDHGQNKGDAPLLPFAHGCMTPDVIHVPLMVWLSPEYRAARPEQTKELESHVNTPFSADTTFHTLLDMAALDCPLLDRRHSAASKDFDPGPRMVRDLEGGLVDYDQTPLPETESKKVDLSTP